MTAALVGAGVPAVAQGVITPNSHWGAIMLPDLDYRADIGVHFIGFTRYGKELGADGNYSFTPYNDIGETIGFNFVSFTRTGFRSRFPISESSVQERRTLQLGVVDDHITEFLQNDAAHWAVIRGRERLRRVPRELDDTFDETGHGPFRRTPIVQYAQEFFFRAEDRERVGARPLSEPSPFFVGAGYSVGTIAHEAFIHVGANPFGVWQPSRDWCAPAIRSCLTFVGVGGMVRPGVVYPSVHLRDLTGSYVNVQAVGEVGITAAGFPLVLNVAVTESRGFFVETRTREDSLEIIERERPAADVYDRKRPKIERFMVLRLRTGVFSVEYVNDEFGGKDKGPSFGLSGSWDISRDDWFGCQVRRYFTIDPARPRPRGVMGKIRAELDRLFGCV